MASDGGQQTNNAEEISRTNKTAAVQSDLHSDPKTTNDNTSDQNPVNTQNLYEKVSDERNVDSVVQSSTVEAAETDGSDVGSETPAVETSNSEQATPESSPAAARQEAEDAESLPPHVEKDPVESPVPSITVDVQGEHPLTHPDDIISSPHGNNAIVERSPGGRYVRFMEKLGSGASKDVYRAYDTQEGIEVAWNVVHLAGVPKTERNRIVNEVRLLERLHHHNIISFHGSWVNREKQQVNFVTEILSSGTLQSFINKVQVIRWKIAKRWAKQILTGLEYLHGQDPPVIHRDLKCENIFINGTSGDLRIGDLGLSTVHRNGRALSVLGTPEFMAPDMYEENAYDEKVDIYAFGMCLLEMFTKEIPYRECSNPAQIYKKVTRGDPPDSLRRLKSKHAREFIELCLGTRDDEGKYIRPSATELMAHPFLQNRPSDDDEVEVDPPMQERVISEVTVSSSSSVKAKSATSSSPRTKIERRSSSVEEDESDRFEEMPDSETSIRQPKVLVGRGQELKREEKPVSQTHKRQESGSSNDDGTNANPLQTSSSALPAVSAQQGALPSTGKPPVAPSSTTTPEAKSTAQQADGSRHYLVAAAVIEDELQTSQPYEDDTLKLVVTLPVDGQTQNVQFDFHLVQDDPIQVAKEMVSELDIPSAAVLEVSETISGLARAARVKQDKYNARQKQHGHVRSQSQGMIPQTRSEIAPQAQGVPSHAMLQSSQNHQSLQDFSMQGSHAAPPVNQQRGVPLHEQPSVLQAQPSQTHQPVQDFSMQGSHAAQPMNQQLGVPLPEQSSQLQAQPPAPQMYIPHQGHLSDPHVVHAQPQTSWNAHVNGQGNSHLPVDPTMSGPPPQSLQHPAVVSNHAPLVRNVSNPSQTEISTTSPAFSQGQLPQQPIPTQASAQLVQDPPVQPTAHYVHSAQSQTVQPHTAVSIGNQGVATHSAPTQQYAHTQGPPQVPLQTTAPGQTMSSQGSEANLGGNFHATASTEVQVQGQYVQGSQSMPVQNQNAASQSVSLHQAGGAHAVHTGLAPSSTGTYGLPVPNAPKAAVAVSEQQTREKHDHHMQGTHQPVEFAANPQLPQQPGDAAMSSQGQGLAVAQGAAPVAQMPTIPKPIDQNTQNLATQPPNRVGGPIETVVGGTAVQQQPIIASGAPSLTDKHVNGVHEVPSVQLDDALDDELLAAELRKLDEDFKKNMMRAQKVFDTRMDNLERSQVQREAQHLKTLEKHEKERADFEKRRQQEEIEQNKRIEQLQKDWASRREAMRQKQAAESSVDGQPPVSNASSGAM